MSTVRARKSRYTVSLLSKGSTAFLSDSVTISENILHPALTWRSTGQSVAQLSFAKVINLGNT